MVDIDIYIFRLLTKFGSLITIHMIFNNLINLIITVEIRKTPKKILKSVKRTDIYFLINGQIEARYLSSNSEEKEKKNKKTFHIFKQRSKTS